MNSQKLTLKAATKILPVAPITITRIAKSDPSFPKLEKIGRSQFIDGDAFLKWLSKNAGFVITDGDYAITGKDLQNTFDKSHTWIWQNVKSKTLPEPFYIGRNTFWMNSQIQALLQSEVA